MGKTILTSKQLNFLECVSKDEQITKNFYFTGGTVLSEFYLKHRLSEDIDLFSEYAEVDPQVPEAFLRKISKKLGIKEFKVSQFLGLVSFILVFQDGETLKVDFNYYPFPRINKGKKYKNLDIDSLYDIAVNKVHTLFMKPRARDYIDLYSIMTTQKDYTLDKLILDAKAKFDWDIDRLNLASQFIRVKEFKIDYPKMLIPFSANQMQEFFVEEARKLKKEIFE